MSTKTEKAPAEPGAAEPSKALATLPADAGGPLSFTSLTADMFSTLPAKDRATVVRLMQGKAIGLDTMIGKKVAIEHVIAHRVSMVDSATGEVKDGTRIVLVTPDGEGYQAVSEGVKNSLRVLAQFYGPPPWTPALVVEVEQIKTRRGFRTYTLSPVA